MDKLTEHKAEGQAQATGAVQEAGQASPLLDGGGGGAYGRLVQRKLARRLARRGQGEMAAGAEHEVARAEQAASGGGAPLPAEVKGKFEGALQTDLSAVRVHTGTESAAAAAAVSAQAYTVGQDVHFAAGKYDPASASGQHLLAHEVSHTVQQGAAPAMQAKLEVSQPGESAESEADSAADSIVKGERAVVSGAPAQISREPERAQGDPDAGPPETPIGYDATGVANGDGTKVVGGPRESAPVLQTLAKNGSLKVTAKAGNYYVVQTASGQKGYVLRTQLDVDGPVTATDAPAEANPYQPIIDKALATLPIDGGETFYHLDPTYGLQLFMKGANRDRPGLLAGMASNSGWLRKKVRPVFGQVGAVGGGAMVYAMVTYQGVNFLARTASHDKTLLADGWHPGNFPDSLEAYRIFPDFAARMSGAAQGGKK